MHLRQRSLVLGLLFWMPAFEAHSQTSDEVQGANGALARRAQNPVADLVSVPFQLNLNYGVGGADEAQYVINLQPVLPISLGERWNLITRTIVPFISMPSPDRTSGLGDLSLSFFFSPKSDGVVTWGIGPILTLPTATAPGLGQGKLGLGPAGVIVLTLPPVVFGMLVNNVWSVAGDPERGDVNQLLVQPFVNLNLQDGWYLSSSPILTANWNAPLEQAWVFPLGGGVGRVFAVGDQQLNGQVAAFWNVVRPSEAPAWTLRVTLVLLFPAA